MSAPRVLTPSRCLLAVAMLLLGADPIRAQGAAVNPVEIIPVDSLLRRFERDSQANQASNFVGPYVARVLRGQIATAARRDSLLDGFEKIAITSASVLARVSAVGHIGSAGVAGIPRATPGVVSRLIRVHDASAQVPAVRSRVLYEMPLQSERRAATQFLKRIVVEQDSRSMTEPDDPTNPGTRALARLAAMGEEGRSVLKELHRRSGSLSRSVRESLEYMAARDFPVRDAVMDSRRP